MRVRRLALWMAVLGSAAGAAEAATWRVCASGCQFSDVQQAIDAAQPGDTILLRAGETFTGHLVLRKKSGTGEILIRSDAPDSELPPHGVRLVPEGRPGANTAMSRLARLRGRGGTWRTTPLIAAEAGAHHYRLQFLRLDGVAQEGYGSLIALGNNTTQTSASMAPYAIVFDRLYIHGDPVWGQKRCVSLDSGSTELLNSYLLHCKHFAEDAQAVAGFNGPGPFKIINNYIEASTENIMFGGADPKIPNLVPSDIEIRRNYITKSLSWRNPVLPAPGSPRAATSSTAGSLSARTHYFKIVALMDSAGSVAHSAPSSEVAISVSSGTTAVNLSWSAVAGAMRYRIYRGTSSGGQSVYLTTPTSSTAFTYTGSGELTGTPRVPTLWNVKNLIELKNAQRVSIEGNVIEHNWKASQTGYALVLTPRNQYNGAPWTVVQDVTIRYNTIRHANGGFNILGRDYSASTGSQLTRRIRVLHNIVYDVGASTWGGGAYFMLITLGPSEIEVNHNTIFQVNTLVLADNGASSGFVFTNNLALHDRYGIFGSGSGIGTAALRDYFPGAVFRRNVLAGGTASLYPSDNFFPTVAEHQAQFVNYQARDYRLVAGSSYIGRGTDGLNLGVDLAALSSAQQGTVPATTTNAAPTASAGGPYAGQPGVAITMDGSASRDPDGSIASYRWDWGDGTAAGSAVRPSHTYAAAGTYTVRLTVTDSAGATGSATTTATIATQATSSTGDIVLTAADVRTTRGHWSRISSTTGAGGQIMSSTDAGWSSASAPVAQPANYFEAPFQAAANTSYRVWLRMRAASNSKSSDSVWVQFTGGVNGQGAPQWRTGTTGALGVNLEDCSGCLVSGWGWQDGLFWAGTPAPIRFEAAGPQTIRVQTREDGVQIDQIVLSPMRYYSSAPGAPTNDGTILPRTALALRPADVVLRADDTVLRRGNWTVESDSGAAEGRRLGSADRGWSSATAPLVSPADYVEATFTAVAGVVYRTWLRLSASGNSSANDSVWVQYTGSITSSGTATLRIGTTSGVLVNRQRCEGCAISGWGWYDANHWNGQTGVVTFATTGVQTIRMQTRQDGVRIDQIVISPSRYASSAPGSRDSDRTIVLPDGTKMTY